MEDAPASDSSAGWVVASGAFLAQAVPFGTLFSFGVFFPAILAEFGKGRGGTAWIVSIAYGILLGSGALAGRLVSRLGPKVVTMAGGLLISGGLALSSVTGELWQVYFSYGVLLGLGASFSFLPGLAAVAQWFEKRRGLVTGLVVSGSGVGTLALAPVTSRLLESVGWRQSLRIVAAVDLVLIVIATILIRDRVKSTGSSGKLNVAHDRNFRALFGAGLFISYGYFLPFVYLVDYASERRIRASSAALLLSVLGLSNVAGRILLGALADRYGRHRILQGSVAVMAVTLALWPLTRSFVFLAAFAVGFGFFSGAFISLWPAMAGEYFGAARVARVLGLLNTGAALGAILSPPVTGFLFDRQGSYTTGILIAAVMTTIGAIVTLRLTAARA